MKKTDDTGKDQSLGSPDKAGRVQFAIEAAGIGFWEIDISADSLTWDRRCKALFGIPEELNPPLSEVIRYIHPEDQDKVKNALDQASKGYRDGKYDMRYRTIGMSDQKIRWVHFIGQAFFNDQNIVTRFGGTGQDFTATQTEIITATEALRLQEAKFHDVTDSAPTGLWLSDEAGGLIYLNRTLVEWTGMPYDALLGAGWANAIIEEDRNRSAEVFLSAVASRSHYDTVFRIRKGTGEIIWCRAAGDPYYRADGSYAGYGGFCMDIDELVNQREAVRQREEHFRNIVEQAPLALGVLTGPELVLQMGNDAIFKIWGKEKSAIGQKIIDVIPEIKGQGFHELLQKVYKTGEAHYGYEALAKLEHNGALKDVYFNFVYTPLRLRGEVVSVMVLATDVSEQVAARNKISEAEVFMRGAVELAELGTWSIDLVTGGLEYSDRMFEWHGFDPKTEPLQDIFSLIEERDRERVKNAIKKALVPDSEGLFDEEYTISHRKTGVKRVLHAQGKTIRNESGIPTKVIGTAQDITVQRRIQLALEQEIQRRTEALDASNEELQAAYEEMAANYEELTQLNEELNASNQDLQQFAHVTSHDLKEPLRKIKTFLSRMQEDPGNVFTERSLSFIERINVSAARMSAMIEGVLKYSTINAGGQVIEPVDLNQTFRDILVDLEMLTKQKNALIQHDALPTIEGASVLLYQLFYNLLINSLKFAAEDRRPVIEIKSTRIEQNKIAFAKIEIRDNGIGFDQSQAGNIFQTFTRLNPKDKYEGTGLGLSLCKKIVQRHHGTITAEGQPDIGSFFTILLPVHQPKESI